MERNLWEFMVKDGYLVNGHLIKSVAELIHCVSFIWEKIWFAKFKGLAEETSWYRGVARAEYKLIPGIYRVKGMEHHWQSAIEMRDEFTRRAPPYMEFRSFRSAHELYHVMQHYGLPTRLLDWTSGMLIALYFAVREFPTDDNKPTPCVWMLNPWWLNEKSTKKRQLFYSGPEKKTEMDRIVSPYFEDKALPLYPIAVLPPHIDKRIVAQRSVFTIHGRERDGFANLCSMHPDAMLAKLCLDGSKTDIFKDELIILGVNETSIFPDLEGLAREIKQEYFGP